MYQRFGVCRVTLSGWICASSGGGGVYVCEYMYVMFTSVEGVGVYSS